MTTTREDAIKRIIEFFEENEDIFNDCIEELDGWDGYLGDDRYYSMDELNDLYCDQDPQEILFRAFYGYDEDSYTTDGSGNREHGPFNPNRDYFRFNGYGNLVSADYKDYYAQLDEYAVEHMAEYRDHIDSIDENDELSELFDALDEEEETEE